MEKKIIKKEGERLILFPSNNALCHIFENEDFFSHQIYWYIIDV